MFRPIRKKKNELSTEDTKQILREARRGVLAATERTVILTQFPSILYMMRLPGGFISTAPAPDTSWTPSRSAIKSASRPTEQKSSARKHGRPICGAPWYSAAAACWKVPRRPWRC